MYLLQDKTGNFVTDITWAQWMRKSEIREGALFENYGDYPQAVKLGEKEEVNSSAHFPDTDAATFVADQIRVLHGYHLIPVER